MLKQVSTAGTVLAHLLVPAPFVPILLPLLLLNPYRNGPRRTQRNVQIRFVRADHHRRSWSRKRHAVPSVSGHAIGTGGPFHSKFPILHFHPLDEIGILAHPSREFHSPSVRANTSHTA